MSFLSRSERRMLAVVAIVGLVLALFGGVAIADEWERKYGDRDRVAITVESTYSSGGYRDRRQYGVVVRIRGDASTQRVESPRLYDDFVAPFEAEASVGRRLRTVWEIHVDGETIHVGTPTGWNLTFGVIIGVLGLGLLAVVPIGVVRVRRRRRRAAEHTETLARTIGVTPPAHLGPQVTMVRAVKVDWEFPGTEPERLWTLSSRPFRRSRRSGLGYWPSPLRCLRIGLRRALVFLSGEPGLTLSTDPVPTLMAKVRRSANGVRLRGKVRKNQPTVLIWIVLPFVGGLAVNGIVILLGAVGLFDLGEIPKWLYFIGFLTWFIPLMVGVNEGIEGFMGRITASLGSVRPSSPVKLLDPRDVERLRTELERQLRGGG